MIEATIRTHRQLQAMRGRAAGIRRGDQVALLAPDDPDGQGIAGAVTGVRAGLDHTVALVVANRVHFVPADHEVVIIRDGAHSGDRTGDIRDGDPPRGGSRRRPGGGPGAGGGAEPGETGHARSPAGTATPTTALREEATT